MILLVLLQGYLYLLYYIAYIAECRVNSDNPCYMF